MERFLLDMEYLPQGKLSFIKKISEKMSAEDRLNLIKGLIYLGFSTVRQEDVTFASGNIGKKKTTGENKLRVQVSNPALEVFLNKQASKKIKRTFIYALLYSGTNSLIGFQEALKQKDVSKKELERIEKLLFLSGLTDFFENQVTVEIGEVIVRNKLPPKLPISETPNNAVIAVAPAEVKSKVDLTEGGAIKTVPDEIKNNIGSDTLDDKPMEHVSEKKWAKKFAKVDAG
jgi:hypothetical protein